MFALLILTSLAASVFAHPEGGHGIGKDESVGKDEDIDDGQLNFGEGIVVQKLLSSVSRQVFAEEKNDDISRGNFVDQQFPDEFQGDIIEAGAGNQKFVGGVAGHQYGGGYDGLHNFGNQQFGNQQFGNQQYGNQQFGNQQFGNQHFGNQHFGNQHFGGNINLGAVDHKFNAGIGSSHFGGEFKHQHNSDQFLGQKFGDELKDIGEPLLFTRQGGLQQYSNAYAGGGHGGAEVINVGYGFDNAHQFGGNHNQFTQVGHGHNGGYTGQQQFHDVQQDFGTTGGIHNDIHDIKGHGVGEQIFDGHRGVSSFSGVHANTNNFAGNQGIKNIPGRFVEVQKQTSGIKAGAVPVISKGPQIHAGPVSHGEDLGPCGDGLSRKADGSCVKPIVSRNIFLYVAPEQKHKVNPVINLPDPKVHYNFVFVKTPNSVFGPKPLVVPPPQQKTLVYVLSKRPDVADQQLIQIPADVSEPEVFFVNYNDGDNPVLPGGIDLQTALSQSAQSAGQFAENDDLAIGGVSGKLGGQVRNFGIAGSFEGNPGQISAGFQGHGHNDFVGIENNFASGNFIGSGYGNPSFIQPRSRLPHGGASSGKLSVLRLNSVGGGVIENDSVSIGKDNEHKEPLDGSHSTNTKTVVNSSKSSESDYIVPVFTTRDIKTRSAKSNESKNE